MRFIRKHGDEIEEIALDHDAGDYRRDGEDYIAILNELERLSRSKIHGPYWSVRLREIKFSIHSMNPVGVENMRRILAHNGWKEVTCKT